MNIPYYFRQEQEIFLLYRSSRLATVPTQPSMQWLIVAFFPGLIRLRLERGHSPPYIAEFKGEGSYASIPPYVLIACHMYHRYNVNK